VRRSFAFLLSFPGFDARSAPAGLVTRLPTIALSTVPRRQPHGLWHEHNERVDSTDLVGT
jgi:hypothetical protein